MRNALRQMLRRLTPARTSELTLVASTTPQRYRNDKPDLLAQILVGGATLSTVRHGGAQ